TPIQLPDKDTSAPLSSHKDALVEPEDLLMTREDLVFQSMLAAIEEDEAEEDSEGDLLTPAMLAAIEEGTVDNLLPPMMLIEADDEREDHLFSPTMLVEADEAPAAVVPSLPDRRTHKTTGTMWPQQATTNNVSALNSGQPVISVPQSRTTPGPSQSSMGASPPKKPQGILTLPPLPSRKQSIIGLGAAVLLTILASVLLYSFNARVAAQVKHAPVAAIATSVPTVHVTQIG